MSESDPGTTPVWTRGAKTHISAGDARNAHTPICRFVPRPGGGHYCSAVITLWYLRGENLVNKNYFE